VRAIESFEVPALLGLPVGIQVFIVCHRPGGAPLPQPDRARIRYGVTLLLITTIGVYFQSAVEQRNKYATMTGKGFRPRPIDSAAGAMSPPLSSWSMLC